MKIGTRNYDEPDETGTILPEADAGEFDEFAGPFLRLLAAFIDFVVCLLIYAASVYVRGLVLGQPVPYLTARPAWALAEDGLPDIDSFIGAVGIELMSIVLIYLIYVATSMGSNMQATPGMRIIGMYVASVDGYPIGRARAFARTLCFFVSLLPAGLGLLLCFIGDKSALHDVICRTRIMLGRE